MWFVGDGSLLTCCQMNFTFASVVFCLIATCYSMPLFDHDENSDSVNKLASVVCEPNSKYLEDCNLCLCSPDGTTTACSTLRCS